MVRARSDWMARWLLVVCWCVLSRCSSGQAITNAENDSLESTFKTALAAQNAGDLERAESILRSMRAAHPGMFAIDESLGLIYVNREKFADALPFLEAAAKEDPGSDVAHANLGAAYFRLHRNRKALEELELAARLDPNNAITQQSLGRLRMETHSPVLAAEAFAAALKSDPANSELMLDCAKALLEANQPAQAFTMLRDVPGADQSVEAQSLLGEAEERLGSYKDAGQHFSRAVELDPSEGNLWMLGVEFLRHWTFDAAIRDFESASAKYPQSVRLRLGLGVAYFGNGNYEKAVPVFADLLRNDPDTRLDAELLGMSCQAVSMEPRPGCSELISYARSHPEDAKASTYAAATIIEGRATDEQTLLASKLLENAIRSDPKMAEAQYEMAVLKQNQADWAGSIPNLEVAVRLKPDFAKAHYRLSLAYWRCGRKDEAQTQRELQKKYHEQEQHELDQRLRQVAIFILDAPA